MQSPTPSSTESVTPSRTYSPTPSPTSSSTAPPSETPIEIPSHTPTPSAVTENIVGPTNGTALGFAASPGSGVMIGAGIGGFILLAGLVVGSVYFVRRRALRSADGSSLISPASSEEGAIMARELRLQPTRSRTIHPTVIAVGPPHSTTAAADSSKGSGSAFVSVKSQKRSFNDSTIAAGANSLSALEPKPSLSTPSSSLNMSPSSPSSSVRVGLPLAQIQNKKSSKIMAPPPPVHPPFTSPARLPTPPPPSPPQAARAPKISRIAPSPSPPVQQPSDIQPSNGKPPLVTAITQPSPPQDQPPAAPEPSSTKPPVSAPATLPPVTMPPSAWEVTSSSPAIPPLTPTESLVPISAPAVLQPAAIPKPTQGNQRKPGDRDRKPPSRPSKDLVTHRPSTEDKHNTERPSKERPSKERPSSSMAPNTNRRPKVPQKHMPLVEPLPFRPKDSAEQTVEDILTDLGDTPVVAPPPPSDPISRPALDLHPPPPVDQSPVGPINGRTVDDVLSELGVPSTMALPTPRDRTIENVLAELEEEEEEPPPPPPVPAVLAPAPKKPSSPLKVKVPSPPRARLPIKPPRVLPDRKKSIPSGLVVPPAPGRALLSGTLEEDLDDNMSSISELTSIADTLSKPSAKPPPPPPPPPPVPPQSHMLSIDNNILNSLRRNSLPPAIMPPPALGSGRVNALASFGSVPVLGSLPGAPGPMLSAGPLLPIEGREAPRVSIGSFGYVPQSNIGSTGPPLSKSTGALNPTVSAGAMQISSVGREAFKPPGSSMNTEDAPLPSLVAQVLSSRKGPMAARGPPGAPLMAVPMHNSAPRNPSSSLPLGFGPPIVTLSTAVLPPSRRGSTDSLSTDMPRMPTRSDTITVFSDTSSAAFHPPRLISGPSAVKPTVQPWRKTAGLAKLRAPIPLKGMATESSVPESSDETKEEGRGAPHIEAWDRV
eukprot:CAMPEP_0184651512 /NCGR_PEP_ID=MMETSP0308-20130426/9151_1 /TAXON_ID=38269 /ORGANISM="Gloeochaete witrockiana, Strain SAG 46.84" /LENGTH=937 /DNA_ID=CAMNT_0027085805 /DNA_START=1482 /DNA_END=4295 /DNA_ORIENTATION=-